jgi:hypothetical protein
MIGRCWRDILVFLIRGVTKPGLSGYLVCLVHMVYLVDLVQPNNPDRPNRLNRPNEQDRLADFFSILSMELCRSVYHANPAMCIPLRSL